MAEEEHKDTTTYKGTDVGEITTEDMGEHIREAMRKVTDSGAVRMAFMGDRLKRLTLDLTKITEEYGLRPDEVMVPIPFSPRSALAPDHEYFMICDDDTEGILNAPIWMCEDDAQRPKGLITEIGTSWTITKIDIASDEGETATPESMTFIAGKHEEPREVTMAEAGLYPDRLYEYALMGDEGDEGKRITYRDVMGGLLMLQATLDMAAKMAEERMGKAKKSGRQKGAGNRPKVAEVQTVTDQLTNALMTPTGKGKKFLPPDYFTGQTKNVKATKKGYVSMSVQAPAEMDLDAAYRDYRLGDAARYWLDGVYTLANMGVTAFKGSDLLRMYGYANPWDDGSMAVMEDAYHWLDVANRTLVWYDTTEERRRGDPTGNLNRSVKRQPVMGGSVEVLEYKDDEGDGRQWYDFEVTLPDYGDPFEALPLGRFARDRNELAAIKTDLFTFETCKPQAQARRAWAYIMRRAHNKTLGNSVLIENMWEDLALEPPTVSTVKRDRQGNVTGERTPKEIERLQRKYTTERQGRILTMLRRMLDEKKQQTRAQKMRNEPPAIASWRIENRKGKPYKITVNLTRDQKDDETAEKPARK